MGKGVILSHEGDSLYLIDYYYNTAKLDDRIAKMTATLLQIDTVEIPAANVRVADQLTAIDTATVALNQAITDEEPSKEISLLTLALNDEKAVLRVLEFNKNALRLKSVELGNEIAYVNSKKIVKEQVSAWCADVNTELIGEVGVMEFPGEGPGVAGHPVIIRPAGSGGGGAVYNGTSDGAMAQTLAMTPEETFYNLAMLPGWQRWRPLYRLGTITFIDEPNDTCTVAMDNNNSSYQGFKTIPKGNLTLVDVPIVYLSCNSQAFLVGDRVVVQIDPADNATITAHGTYTGTVIGFESNPVACCAPIPTLTGEADIDFSNPAGYVYTLNDYKGAVTWAITEGGGSPASGVTLTPLTENTAKVITTAACGAYKLTATDSRCADFSLGLYAPGGWTVVHDYAHIGCLGEDPEGPGVHYYSETFMSWQHSFGGLSGYTYLYGPEDPSKRTRYLMGCTTETPGPGDALYDYGCIGNFPEELVTIRDNYNNPIPRENCFAWDWQDEEYVCL